MVSLHWVPPEVALGKRLAIHFCAVLKQRECPLFDEHLPQSKKIRGIDGEHMNCDPTDGGSSDKLCP
jgi:hypothetical protein